MIYSVSHKNPHRVVAAVSSNVFIYIYIIVVVVVVVYPRSAIQKRNTKRQRKRGAPGVGEKACMHMYAYVRVCGLLLFVCLSAQGKKQTAAP
eukprot:gene10969-7614_t